MLIVLFALPESTPGPWVRVVLWLVFILLHVGVWHWVIRAGLLLYDQENLEDLRGATDEPFGIWRRVLGRLARG